MTIDIKDTTAIAGRIEIIKEGIVKYIYNGVPYYFWHIADVVYSYIFKFLKGQFPSPDNIIAKEFDKIDFVATNKNLPIEVQSTTLSLKGRPGLNHSEFEQKIEKQLKQNIDKFDRCWFFFDSEYKKQNCV